MLRSSKQLHTSQSFSSAAFTLDLFAFLFFDMKCPTFKTEPHSHLLISTGPLILTDPNICSYNSNVNHSIKQVK